MTSDILDLHYAECTWETWDEIKDQAQDAIAAYQTRMARSTVPARSIAYPSHARPAYQKIAEDPDYLKPCGELKPFQLTGLNWLAYLWCQGGQGGMLADEVSCRVVAADISDGAG